MQPMKPAPMSTTREPFLVAAAILRPSSSVQQFSTPSKSMPGIGGRAACEPVAISNRSNPVSPPLASVTDFLSAETAVT